MDGNNRELLILRTCGGTAVHLRNRAPKQQHQTEAKKNADDFWFHVICFPFLFWFSVISRHWELISGDNSVSFVSKFGFLIQTTKGTGIQSSGEFLWAICVRGR